MESISRIRACIKDSFLPKVPKKLQQRFLTGIEAFSLQEFRSINANGRRTATRDETGEMRVFRLLRDTRMKGYLIKGMIELVAKLPAIDLALDHSTFGVFKIGCLSMKTGRGRGIPVWLYVDFEKCGRKNMRSALMKALKQIVPVFQGKQITLCMDRWFPSQELVGYCNEVAIHFIARMRSNIHLETPWEKEQLIYEISKDDIPVKYHAIAFRLVQSDYHEGMKQKEPWFLLTNDMSSSRQKIINKYAHRFEIEEVFKDIKWVQNYEWQQIHTPLVLETLLLFAFCGWWLMWSCMQPIIKKSRSRSLNVHKRKSWFRVCLESLLKASLSPKFKFTPP